LNILNTKNKSSNNPFKDKNAAEVWKKLKSNSRPVDKEQILKGIRKENVPSNG
jgi:hypothetical protein